MVIKKAICMHEEDYGAPPAALLTTLSWIQQCADRRPGTHADNWHIRSMVRSCAGVLWKHTEYRTEHLEARRSRRLVISFFATIANYECECSTPAADTRQACPLATQQMCKSS